MTQHSRLPAKRDRGLLIALALAAALLVVSSAGAVAPPPRPAPIPEGPGPDPLFNPEGVHADPVRMALSVFGGSTTPTGPWSSVAVLYAGEHPKVQAWKLEGVMTNRFTRWNCGAATAVLAGFQGGSLGLGALAELATLKVGDRPLLDCWFLRDTDQFHPLRKERLSAAIIDGRGIPAGGFEATVYSEVLIRANYTSAAAFHKAVRTDLTYSHIFNNPDEYRGEVVRIAGKLKRINRFTPPPEATDEGVNDLYEAWVFSEFLGSNPYVVIFTEWPAGLPRNLLGRDKIPGTFTVAMDGYFFKKFRYKANDGKNTQRDAPLLIGHTLSVNPIPPVVGESSKWLNKLVYGIVGVFGSLLATVVGLTWWFRRTDNNVRRRLLAARSPEFVLPPPDALPIAAPVGPPPKRVNGTDRTMPPPRITFIAGSGDRRGEAPSDEGGKRGSGDKPSEEAAGRSRGRERE